MLALGFGQKQKGVDMVRLMVDDKLCTACGTCELILPDFLSKIKDNSLLISPKNFSENCNDVYRAVNSCRNNALQVEMVL